MAYRNLATGMLVIGLAALQGCAPLVVAGGATAVSAAHDRRTLGAYIDDQAIELKAVSAINADEAPARETHVNVTSVNGFVLLSGETPDHGTARPRLDPGTGRAGRTPHRQRNPNQPTHFDRQPRQRYLAHD